MGERDMSILVIDRDEATCALLREILDAEGYGTTWCTNLAMAEEAVIYTQPAVILLGVTRLDEPELTVIEMIRRHGPSVPIVLMSTSLDLREWAEQAGVEGYLGKPFDVTSPPIAVAQVLRSARDARSNRRSSSSSPERNGEPNGVGGLYLFQRHPWPV